MPNQPMSCPVRPRKGEDDDYVAAGTIVVKRSLFGEKSGTPPRPGVVAMRGLLRMLDATCLSFTLFKNPRRVTRST